VSGARHDLRNKLATIRNACFYLRRRAGETALATDERVAQFFDVIDQEIAAAEELLAHGIPRHPLFERQVRAIPIGACLRAAVAAIRAAQQPAVELEIHPDVHGLT